MTALTISLSRDRTDGKQPEKNNHRMVICGGLLYGIKSDGRGITGAWRGASSRSPLVSPGAPLSATGAGAPTRHQRQLVPKGTTGRENKILRQIHFCVSQIFTVFFISNVLYPLNLYYFKIFLRNLHPTCSWKVKLFLHCSSLYLYLLVFTFRETKHRPQIIIFQ